MPPPSRTLFLRERVMRECRLARADVDFLLTEHRPHVEVVPAGWRGRYRLTATGHVGTIVTPGCRLVIRPKIPLSNLFHLLDPTAPAHAADDRARAVAGAEALDFLAARLGRLLAERAAAGLHRGYVERAEQGAFLQGRLDVPAQLRGAGARKDALHCRYQEFTTDVPCNQVPKAVAELVLRSPLVAEPARAAVRQGLAGFDGVAAAPLAPDSFRRAAPDRLTAPYRPLLDVCRLLAEGLSPGEAAGTMACPAFLLNMERVFEEYVTRGVIEGCSGRGPFEVAVQPLHVANRPAAGQPDIHMRPDLLLRRDGVQAAVIDAKWKDVEAAAPEAADVYQVLAYSTALGVGRGVLVYPGRRERVWTYEMAGAPVTLVVRTVRVVGTPEACRRSLRRLARSLRAAAAAGSSQGSLP
jgi:5-methylcytosine-specific restriction enzyme subunit McrC